MKTKQKYIVVYATFPKMRVAKKIVNGLIGNKLVACGNLFKLSSIYIWRGKIEQCPEYGALIKTTKKNYKKVERFIKKNHPYEVPEIISWTIERGLEEYLSWINKET